MMGSWEAGVGSALTPLSGEWENEHFFCGLLVHVCVCTCACAHVTQEQGQFFPLTTPEYFP